jgi:hypothetical protein
MFGFSVALGFCGVYLHIDLSSSNMAVAPLLFTSERRDEGANLADDIRRVDHVSSCQ